MVDRGDRVLSDERDQPVPHCVKEWIVCDDKRLSAALCKPRERSFQIGGRACADNDESPTSSGGGRLGIAEDDIRSLGVCEKAHHSGVGHHLNQQFESLGFELAGHEVNTAEIPPWP